MTALYLALAGGFLLVCVLLALFWPFRRRSRGVEMLQLKPYAKAGRARREEDTTVETALIAATVFTDRSEGCDSGGGSSGD